MRRPPHAIGLLAGADFRRGDGRERRHHADAEQERRLIEIEPERAGRERMRRQPAAS